jgi:hypothetical protein
MGSARTVCVRLEETLDSAMDKFYQRDSATPCEWIFVSQFFLRARRRSRARGTPGPASRT